MHRPLLCPWSWWAQPPYPASSAPRCFQFGRAKATRPPPYFSPRNTDPTNPPQPPYRRFHPRRCAWWHPHPPVGMDGSVQSLLPLGIWPSSDEGDAFDIAPEWKASLLKRYANPSAYRKLKVGVVPRRRWLRPAQSDWRPPCTPESTRRSRARGPGPGRRP